MVDISAIIPTRNRPDLLREALASVRRQTLAACEILVVDEASDPPVARWLGGDDVRIIRHESSHGPAGARNAGAAVAAGEYVAFLDDDDIWLDGKLEAVAECIESNPGMGAIFHQIVSWGEHAAQTRDFVVLDDAVARMLGRRPPHASTLVVATDVHRAVRFDPAYRGAEDLDYNVRLASAGRIVEMLGAFARIQPREENPSEIAIQTRIEGRERFRAQHGALFTEPRFERHHRTQLAHLHRRAGHRTQALKMFASLMVDDPSDMAAWKGLASSFLPLSWPAKLGGRWRRIGRRHREWNQSPGP